MSERLEALLIGERVLPAAIVREAVARQRVYGGALDTALLEMGVMSEGALWARLATATGLPVPAPALADGGEAGDLTHAPLSQKQTAWLRAVPVGLHRATEPAIGEPAIGEPAIGEPGTRETDRTLKVLCAEPVAADEIRMAVSRAGYQAKLYVVPEVRLLALRQRLYGETLPPRFAPILARGIGAERARKAFCAPKATVTAQTSAVGGPNGIAAPPPTGAPPMRTPPVDPLIKATPNPAPVPPPVGRGRSPGAEPTPLEVVLDFSQPLLVDSTLEQAIELGEEDLQVVDPDRIPFTDAGDGVPLAESSSAPSDENPADSATESLCRRARNRDDKGRVLALRALRRRLDRPLALAFVATLREEAANQDDDLSAVAALECLAELRDEVAIPIFIDRLASSTSQVRLAAGQALVMLTARDFADAATWEAWWNNNAPRPRAEWLLEALGDDDAATRGLAFEELRHLSGETFGYAPELPKRKREAARKRWATWWETRRARADQAVQVDARR